MDVSAVSGTERVSNGAEGLRADRPPPPKSMISLYELGFGTVAGICAGVFTKKGIKAAAWLLGGVFVLLQVSGISLMNLSVDTTSHPCIAS